MADWKTLIPLLKPCWDPIPYWIKLKDDKIKKFNEIQNMYNEKIMELQIQKAAELEQITGELMK